MLEPTTTEREPMDWEPEAVTYMRRRLRGMLRAEGHGLLLGRLTVREGSEIVQYINALRADAACWQRLRAFAMHPGVGMVQVSFDNDADDGLPACIDVIELTEAYDPNNEAWASTLEVAVMRDLKPLVPYARRHPTRGGGMSVLCSYCARPAKRFEGVFGVWWECLPCGARVGCHKGTSRPKGTFAKAELRAARIAAHAAFDALWRDGGMSRSHAYAWLGGVLGLKKDACHIGMFTEQQCADTVRASANKPCAAIQHEMNTTETGGGT